jgi:HNH endonuclease
VTATLLQRFDAKVDRDGPGGCWLWLGYIDRAGYGRLRTGGRGEPVNYAHRIAYEQHVGPIPAGTELDHLCRVRRCCCPTHLEAVPHAVNAWRGAAPTVVTAREDRCKRGHPFSANAYTHPRTGKRQCRACRRARRAAGAA